MKAEPTSAVTDALETKRRAFARHRTFATGLLLVAAAIFAATWIAPDPGVWVLLVRAGSEAAMVGGLADWFAVTALFRRPLGLPIPHTALVPRNKDRIGAGLGAFVERNFLDPSLVGARLRLLDPGAMIARWLSRRENADAVAERIVAAVPVVMETIDDRTVRDFLRRALERQIDKVDLAPLLSRLLALLTEGDHHQAVFDQAIRIARRLLLENEDRIDEMVGERSRWWVPTTVDRRVAEALVAGAIDLLGDLAQPDHPARARFEQAVVDLTDRLARSPDAQAKVAAIKAELLRNPAVEDYLLSLWSGLRARIVGGAAAESSTIRGALAGGLQSLGGALLADDGMRGRLNRRIEKAVLGLVVPFRAEIGAFIADVVRRWDARTLTERLEVEVGRDLQFIRVNGTIVGALVGCALFGISRLLGH